MNKFSQYNKNLNCQASEQSEQFVQIQMQKTNQGNKRQKSNCLRHPAQKKSNKTTTFC